MERWTEFHVTVVDAFGDAVDTRVWDTLREARADFNGFHVADDCAAVLERVTRYDFHSGREDRFEVVDERGSYAALSEWHGVTAGPTD